MSFELAEHRAAMWVILAVVLAVVLFLSCSIQTLVFQLELEVSPKSYQTTLTLSELIGKYCPGALASRGHDL